MIKLRSDMADKKYPTRREFISPGQEGLISWLKDVGDRIKSNADDMLKAKDCKAIVAALDKADMKAFADMSDREAGYPMYSKQEFNDFVTAIPGTASFLNSQVTPTFKKMMSISDKDVAEFLRGKETGKLAEFNKKCLDMAKTIKSQKNNPVHVVAMYSDNTYFSKCGATDPTVDIWGNNSKYKTYKQLGYTNPKDFAPIFESWTEFVENTGKIGQLTKAMYTANNALCDFASDKLRVDHTGKLPLGIKELWHIFMYGCCSIYNCDEGWFFTIGGLENNFMSAKRALYRLSRVCNVKVGD